jgi:hypothetical protein
MNNSDRPLLLLAGEIVTGGKQDRVIGRDRIVPPHAEPVDLSVFCVEPGRWTGTTEKFGSSSSTFAQPSVRNRAMAARDQGQMWSEVGKSNRAMVAAVPQAGAAIAGSSSYSTVNDAKEVQHEVDKVAQPITRSYESLIKQLRDNNAVGVVVAVNGNLEWADLFASGELLQKYWPKLVRSYAAESITVAKAEFKPPGAAEAQRFVTQLRGNREVAETEPGIYRQTEVQGTGFAVFRLTSLLPNTNFDVHIAKMTTNDDKTEKPMR